MRDSEPKSGQQPAPPPRKSRPLRAMLNRLVRAAGADPSTFDGRLVREMMQTAANLVRDGAETGELKLTTRSLRELRSALQVFRPYRDIPRVTVFGSARTPENNPNFEVAEDFARRMTQEGWMTITGAGGGIMRAAQGGAGRANSFGVGIRLPFETNANEHIEGDEKLIVFRYFFTRKLMFVWQADAVALLPGGFGTLDECFEILTLMQTGKAPLMPLVMIDPPGSRYWHTLRQHLREHLLANELISPDDVDLARLVESSEEAVREVRGFYRNYHSQRFVRDELVLRLKRPLRASQLERLNEEFADLVEEGEIEPTEALPEEKKHRELPRLKWRFTRNGYGRLRKMIDRINEFDASNEGNGTKDAGA